MIIKSTRIHRNKLKTRTGN